MSDIIGFIIKTLKPFFADLKVEVDNKAQTITFRRKEEVKILSFEELAEQIRQAFTDE